jgi:hypothetical protein
MGDIENPRLKGYLDEDCIDIRYKNGLLLPNANNGYSDVEDRHWLLLF